VSAGELAALVRRLGPAVAADDATAEGVAELAASAGVAGVMAVHVVPRGSLPDTVELQLAPAAALAALEAELGAGRALPRSGPGAPREVVLGGDGGESGWSVLATVDGDGAVPALTVRRER
jgi:hypothetical protein